ncbi:MAG: NERD domain-containing protein [Phycisphaeraceae bacterium]|nr:NERD domain-containing protein [Phycisphaeraceae bacterium]
MIIKQLADMPTPSDPRLAAGIAAERQMAFYLNRAFAAHPEVLVLNDLRLVDSDQPDPDGSSGVCQIDHLVLHRWGAFVVESKSVHDEVSIKPDGAGGDEWTRRYRGRDMGFPSPIQQARRQAEFLRAFLQCNRELLLGKAPIGLRTVTRAFAGSDQRGFGHMPIQIIIAISDGGKINRQQGWEAPSAPFRTYVCKADSVTDRIESDREEHRRNSGILSLADTEYGMWQMSSEELARVAAFLLARHTPSAPTTSRGTNEATEAASDAVEMRVQRSPAQSIATTPDTSASSPRGGVATPSPIAPPTCKACSGSGLTAHWGKYGYYWKCDACGTNSAMPTLCSACGAEGKRGQTVRIRKEGPKYFRHCDACGIEERIWTEA